MRCRLLTETGKTSRDRAWLRCLLFLALPAAAIAELPPVATNGYLEYQIRKQSGDRQEDSLVNLATWRINASTYVRQPWILQLDGGLGITRTDTDRASSDQDGNLLTGEFRMKFFPLSPFPFTAFYENRDSRVDGDLTDLDLTSETYGFSQQFAPRGGGRYSLDYRHITDDELRQDGFEDRRGQDSDNWQLNLARSFGSHTLNLISDARDIQRDEPFQDEERLSHTLQHRFRSSPRFFFEDTTFYSDESLELDGTETQRRFFQLHGISNWRPATKKPMLITGTALVQATESGISGASNDADNMVVTGSMSYQWSPNLSFSANVGATVSKTDDVEDRSTVFERVRATYISRDKFFGANRYSWGGTLETGNRKIDENDDRTIQEYSASFGHSMSQNIQIGSNAQLQFNIGQEVSTASDTDSRSLQTLTHTAFVGWNKQNGKSASFVRLTATDRRRSSDDDDDFQLVNFQASRTMRNSRLSSWTGSLTVQYIRTKQDRLDTVETDNRSTSYSANLSYVHRQLFDVRQLSFTSELRLLSNDFKSADPLDQELNDTQDREDKVWRNRLDYRIGRLRIGLHANLADIDGDISSFIFLNIRRAFGAL